MRMFYHDDRGEGQEEEWRRAPVVFSIGPSDRTFGKLNLMMGSNSSNKGIELMVQAPSSPRLKSVYHADYQFALQVLLYNAHRHLQYRFVSVLLK